MSEVIDLFSEREKRKPQPDHAEYLFTVDIYASDEDGASGKIYGVDIVEGVSDADRFRMMAGRLEEVAKMLHDRATELEPDDDGFMLARVKVYESSRVKAWVSERISDATGVEWMERRLDDAKSIVGPANA